MARRGFTLIEILVALLVFCVVASMAMYVLTAQNDSWKAESDKNASQLMAKATLDELSRAVRTTGGGLPPNQGGMRVFADGEERVTFVANEGGGSDQVLGADWIPGTERLKLAVANAWQFSLKGYVRLNLTVPPPGSNASTSTTVSQAFTLPVVERISSAAGGCRDSIVLDVSSLERLPNGWNQAGDIVATNGAMVLSIDSITYLKSNDTLFVKRNTLDSLPFVIGVDQFQLRYFHPNAGWQDSLSGVAPADQIMKVQIRLVMRSLKPDYKLLKQSPATRGYRFATLETEVGLRTSNLVNR